MPRRRRYEEHPSRFLPCAHIIVCCAAEEGRSCRVCKTSNSQFILCFLRQSAYFAHLTALQTDAVFDRLVREMNFEQKARASDRTRTPEELAREARDRLELMEVRPLSFVHLHVLGPYILVL